MKKLKSSIIGLTLLSFVMFFSLSFLPESIGQTKSVTFKVVGDEIFDFSPSKDLKVGKNPSKDFQKELAKYNCPDSYSYTDVKVIGAGRNVISKAKLRSNVVIKSGRWLLDESEENVFRMRLSCLFDATLKLTQSGYYVFELSNRGVFNDNSPRYDLNTLANNRWTVTYFDIPKGSREGYTRWAPALPTPDPKFEILSSSVINGNRVTKLKLISSIYGRGKFYSNRTADDYWEVQVFDSNDQNISGLYGFETFGVSNQEGLETKFRFRVDGSSSPSCSGETKDDCTPKNWIFTLDSTGKQITLNSIYRE
jgi:hypothetical protein